MATKQSIGTLSKSDAVREYLSSHATAPVKEIAAPSEQGVEASIALINKIKYSDRKSPRRRKLVRRRRRWRRSKGCEQSASDSRRTGNLGRRARPRDVIAHLKEGGVTVSAAQVSAIRKGFRKNGRLKRSATGLASRQTPTAESWSST